MRACASAMGARQTSSIWAFQELTFTVEYTATTCVLRINLLATWKNSSKRGHWRSCRHSMIPSTSRASSGSITAKYSATGTERAMMPPKRKECANVQKITQGTGVIRRALTPKIGHGQLCQLYVTIATTWNGTVSAARATLVLAYLAKTVK